MCWSYGDCHAETSQFSLHGLIPVFTECVLRGPKCIHLLG
ncbi:unnamed protein product [Brassica oleracea var. botrytis]